MRTAARFLLALVTLALVLPPASAQSATQIPTNEESGFTFDAHGNITARNFEYLYNDTAAAFRQAADTNGDGVLDANETAMVEETRAAHFDGPDSETTLDGQPYTDSSPETISTRVRGNATSSQQIVLETTYVMSATISGDGEHTWTRVLNPNETRFALALGEGMEIVRVENLTQTDACHASVRNPSANATLVLVFRLGAGLCVPPKLFDSHVELTSKNETVIHADILTHYYGANGAAFRKSWDANKDGFVNETEAAGVQAKARTGLASKGVDEELSIDGANMTYGVPDVVMTALANTNITDNSTVTADEQFDLTLNGALANATTHTILRHLDIAQSGDWNYTAAPGTRITSVTNLTKVDECHATGNATRGDFTIVFEEAPDGCGADGRVPTATPSPTPVTATSSATPATLPPTPGVPGPSVGLVLAMLAVAALLVRVARR